MRRIGRGSTQITFSIFQIRDHPFDQLNPRSIKNMKPQTKIYIGASLAVIFAIGIIGAAGWSNYRIKKLESDVEKAKTNADSIQRSALGKEIKAAEYKQKIDYLERQLAGIQTIARKQDEELKRTNDNNRTARGDLDRARRTRSIEATTEELCAKLAELGHGCR